jgi:hypothetical protein
MRSTGISWFTLKPHAARAPAVPFSLGTSLDIPTGASPSTLFVFTIPQGELVTL